MSCRHTLLAVLVSISALGAAPAQPAAPMPDKEWKTWLEDVKPLMMASEATAAKQTAPSDRARFRDEFWRLRDPERASADNPVRAEYEKRVQSADRRFRFNRTGPWNDCGRVFLVLGKPTRVQVTAASMPESNDGIYKGEMGGQESWIYRHHPRLPTTADEFRFSFNNSCEGGGRLDTFGRLLQFAAISYVKSAE
jgi:GWxTD domain-containing protein